MHSARVRSAASPIPQITSLRGIPGADAAGLPTARTITGAMSSTTRPRPDADRRKSSTTTRSGCWRTFSSIPALTAARQIPWCLSSTIAMPARRSRLFPPSHAAATASPLSRGRLRPATCAARTVTGAGPTSNSGGGGAPGTIRTCNLLIRSQMLYPLSYGRLAGQESNRRAHDPLRRATSGCGPLPPSRRSRRPTREPRSRPPSIPTTSRRPGACRWRAPRAESGPLARASG